MPIHRTQAIFSTPSELLGSQRRSMDDNQATFSYSLTKPAPPEPVEHSYRVRHFQQNVEGTDYVLADQEELTAREGAVEIMPREYEGFNVNTGKSTLSAELTEDGQVRGERDGVQGTWTFKGWEASHRSR